MKQILPSFLVACALSAPALAQTPADDTEDSTRQAPIIVNATRLETPLAQTGAAITILSQEDMRALGYDFAVDALVSVPGLTAYSTGAYGGQSSVRIRGASAAHTLVVLDGVPLNDPTSPSGGYDFSRFDVSMLDRVEILRGAQSTLWGSEAMGGVVYITSPRSTDELTATAFGEVGSFSTFRGGASVAGGHNGHDFRIGLTGIQTDGISKAEEEDGNPEKDGYEALHFHSRAGLQITHDAKLDLSLSYSDSETDIDGFNAFFQFADTNEQSLTTQLAASGKLSFPLFSDALQNDVVIGRSEIERELIGPFGATYDGTRDTARYQGTVEIAPATRIAFGAEANEDSDESSNLSRSSSGFFALLETAVSPNLNLSAGLRHDSHDGFDGETTYRLSAAWAATTELTGRMSIGTGYKVPSLFQQTAFFFPATAPNLNLEPEQADGFDIGFDYLRDNGAFAFSLTYFENDTTNLIDYANGTYFNIARAERKGLEVDSQVQINAWANLSGTLTLMDAKDESGQALLRVPDVTGDITLGLSPLEKWSGAIHIRHTGPMQDASARVDAWTRLDASISHAFSDRLEFYARAENLTDEQYQQLAGYGTPGLSGQLGIRLTY